MKSILDPLFRYRPSFATDVRATFERIRREKKAAPDAIPATSAEQSISDFACLALLTNGSVPMSVLLANLQEGVLQQSANR